MVWLSTFFVFFYTIFPGPELDVKVLRQLFLEGSENKAQAEALFGKVGEYGGKDAILIAYKGGAYALKAKHGGNPINKLRNIKKAQSYFADAVQRESENLEIRFMRYAVEVQTPAKLGMSEHVEEDKAKLLEGLKRYPKSGFTPETARIARDYLRQYCSCTEEEKRFVQKIDI